MSYQIAIKGAVQGDGAQTVTIPKSSYTKEKVGVVLHQVTIEPDGATVGTVAIEWLPWGSSTYEELKDNMGNAIVASLTRAESYSFTANAVAIKCTPAGADGTYNILCSGW